MKVKISRKDFVENGGKLFLSYMNILNRWYSEQIGKTLNMFTEKIAKQLLIDHGFNDGNWSQEKHTLQSAGHQIRKLFITKKSALENFDIEIEFDTDTGDIKIVERTPEPETENRPADQENESEPLEASNLEDKNEDPELAETRSNDTISYLSLPASPAMPSGLHEHVMDEIDDVIQKLATPVTDENPGARPSMAIKSEPSSEPTNDPNSPESEQPPKKKIKTSENDEDDETPKTQPLDLRTGECQQENSQAVLTRHERSVDETQNF